MHHTFNIRPFMYSHFFQKLTKWLYRSTARVFQNLSANKSTTNCFQRLNDTMHRQQIFQKLNNPMHLQIVQYIYSQFFQTLNDSMHLQQFFFQMLNDSIHLQLIFMFFSKAEWLNASTIFFLLMLSLPVHLFIQSCIDLLIYLFIWFI